MELIVISESKLKIMLTAPDMQRYELDPEELGKSDPHGKQAFRHLLADCGEEIGFETEGERLLVQLYASKEGGCEIFVTKMGRPEAQEEYRLTDGERALRSRILEEEDDLPFTGEAEASWERPREREAAFRFGDLSAAIGACRRLRRLGRGGGACYITEDGGILLFLSLPVARGLRLHPSVAFLTEYGREISSEGLDLYLGEYAHPVAEENAVSLLADF